MKNYRKLFAWLMTVIMLLGMLPTASAELVGPAGPVNCNHVWDGGRWLRGEPQNCCDWKPKTYTCTLCQATFTNEEAGRCVAGPKTWVIPQAANCQEHGVWEICCKVCGEWMDGMEEPGPHNWVVEEPTCTYPGNKETVCSVCGDEYQDAYQEIPALGHDWGPDTVDHPGNCILPGLMSHMCKRCNTREEWEIAYGDHSWGEWKQISEGTCVNPGKESRTCSVCKKVEERTTGGGGHEMGYWYRSGIPTCVVEGKMRRDCERDGCDYYETEPIPMVDHAFGEWRVVEEPQVGLPGYERRFCVYQCGTYEEREIPPLEGDGIGGNVTLITVVTTTPANGEYYVPGEHVSYEVTMTNNTNSGLLNAAASQDGYTISIAAQEIVAGYSFTFHIGGDVSEEDAERGYIDAQFDGQWTFTLGGDGTVSADNVRIPCGFPAADVNGLTVAKSAPDGSHNKYYYVGEEVPFTITVTNNTGVELVDVEITDPIKGSNEDAIVDRIPTLQPGESVSVTFNYTVTEADAAIGTECFDNIAYATGYTADGTQVSGTSNKVRVWCVIPHEVTLTKTVGNTPANGEYFVPGELIEFKVYIKNGTPYPLYCVTLTDPLCEDQHIYDEVNDMSYIFFDNLYREGAGGDTIFDQRIVLDYIVTEADAEAGFVTNTAFVEYMTWYGEEKTASATATAKCGKPADDDADVADGLTVTWTYTNTPANGEYFTPGEVVYYMATITNTGSVQLNSLAVGADVTMSKIPSVSTIAPGQTIVCHYNDLLEEEDVQSGSITSKAYVTGYTTASPTMEGTVNAVSAPVTVPVGKGKDTPAVYYHKAVINAPANGCFFTEGETIEYKLSLINNGKKDIYSITLKDPLSNSRSVAYARKLVAGDVLQGTFTYVVTAADVANGQVVNTATSTWEAKANGTLTTTLSNTIVTPCGSGDPTTDRVDAMLEKYVSNAPANGEYFVPGETIEYAVIFMNVCPHDLHDVEVMDPLKGSNEDLVIASEPVVEREGTLYLSFNYVVTEEDAERGYVENTASAFWLNPEIEEWSSCESNTVVTDVGMPEGVHLIKTIENAPANGQFFVPGEVINFVITVQNSMGKTLDVVVLTDPLSADFYHELLDIPGGAVDSRTLSYTVTELDAAIGSITNCAYAVAYADGTPRSLTSNNVTVPCGFPDNDGDGQPDDIYGIHICLEITKEVESLPLNGSYYTAGETVAYKITYVNAGEMPLTDVMIYDAMGGMTEIATAETLQPSESRVCWYNHTVTEADVQMGYITNTAVGQFELSGFLNTVTSNTVVVDTDGKNDEWIVLPPWDLGDHPNYTPDIGWTEFFVPTPGTEDPDDVLPPFGTIDTDKLRSGKSSCVRTITGRDNASANYEVSFCEEHVITQASVLMMKQLGTTPEMQMQAAAYAVALWRAEAAKLYQELFDAADSTAKAVLMTEYVRFVADMVNYEAMLKALNPDQPALVAQQVAAKWEDKCVTLCYEMHTSAEARKDSLLSVAATTGAAADMCACTITGEEKGKQTVEQTCCPIHSFPFSRVDMLTKGQDTAEAWTMVRQIWCVELTNAYNQLSVKLGDDKLLALAENNAFLQWMMAREAALIALYPNNPEVVAQTMVKVIMDRVNDLCLTGK